MGESVSLQSCVVGSYGSAVSSSGAGPPRAMLGAGRVPAEGMAFHDTPTECSWGAVLLEPLKM